MILFQERQENPASLFFVLFAKSAKTVQIEIELSFYKRKQANIKSPARII